MFHLRQDEFLRHTVLSTTLPNNKQTWETGVKGMRMTPQQKLHKLAVDSISSSRRSPDLAVSKFITYVIEAPDADELLVALITVDQLRNIALAYLREVLSRDMNGGGIGLPVPVAKKTPADLLAGGGPEARDIQRRIAFPSSSKTWSPEDVTRVREHDRLKPGRLPGSSKPRVPPDQQMLAHTRHAMTLLDSIKVRGKPIGDWTHEEAMEQAERNDYDSRLLRAFASGVPPLSKIRDFITPEQAQEIMKKLESADAA